MYIYCIIPVYTYVWILFLTVEKVVALGIRADSVEVATDRECQSNLVQIMGSLVSRLAPQMF
jgi:hypothetical protein